MEHERNYGWGMDAPVTVFSWNERNCGLGMDALFHKYDLFEFFEGRLEKGLLK